MLSFIKIFCSTITKCSVLLKKKNDKSVTLHVFQQTVVLLLFKIKQNNTTQSHCNKCHVFSFVFLFTL